MAIKSDEITRVLKERIEGFDPETELKEVAPVGIFPSRQRGGYLYHRLLEKPTKRLLHRRQER